MISRSSATVEPGGVLRSVTCESPLTLRRVHSDDPTVCALCLVGTAAGPLGGDDLALDLTITGAATLQASGASLAQAGSSTLRMSASVDGSLDASPGALIVSHGAHVDVTVALSLTAGSTLRWRELLVLGRTGEPLGTATLRWDVERAGRPLLRQAVSLRDLGWPGLVGGHRVMLTELAVGKLATTTVLGPSAVTQKVADDVTLTTVLAPSADAALRHA